MLGIISPLSWRFVRVWLLTINLFLWMNLSRSFSNESIYITDGSQTVRTAAVSSDGRLMVYLKDEGSKTGAYLRFVKDKGVGIRISGLPERIHSLGFSPEGDRLVLSARIGEQSKLFVKGLKDKQSAEQITFGEGSDYHPRFSADGTEIAFDSDREGNFEIYMMNLGTQNVRRITSWKQPDFAPSIAPDNQWVAYTSARGNTFQIFLQNLKITNSLPVQLTMDEATASNPVFTADGKIVLFESNMEGRNRIYGIHLKDNVLRRIVDSEGVAQRPAVAKNQLFYAVEESGVSGIRAVTLQPFEQYPEVTTRLPVTRPPLPLAVAAPPASDVSVQLVNEIKEMEKGFEGYDFDLSFLDQPLSSTAAVIASQPVETPVQTAELQPEDLEEPGEDPLLNFQPEPQPVRKDKLAEHFSIKKESLIAQTIPASNQQEVSPLTPISLILKAVPSLIGKGLLQPRLLGPEGEIETTVTFHEALRRVDIVPTAPLLEGTQYRLVAPEEILQFKTAGVSQKTRAVASGKSDDLAKPNTSMPLRIVRSFPEDRARNMKVTTPVRVRFNQKLLPESVSPESLQLFHNNQMVPGELVFEDSDQELSLKPYHNLLEASVYEVRLSRELLSKDHQPLEATTRFQFKTQHFTPFLVSEFPPTVLSEQRAGIEFRLNRPADPRTLNSEEFQLRGAVGPIAGKVELLDRGMVLRFSPWQQLPADQDLVFYLSPNLRDRDGNLLENARPFTVSTRFEKPQARSEPPGAASALLGPDLALLRELSAMGVLKGRGVEAVLSGKEQPERFRIALILEEALNSMDMLVPAKRQELLLMAQDYAVELKNLGVDVQRISQSIRKPRPAAPRGARDNEAVPAMRPSGSQQSYGEQVPDDFVGRGRQI